MLLLRSEASCLAGMANQFVFSTFRGLVRVDLYAGDVIPGQAGIPSLEDSRKCPVFIVLDDKEPT